LRRPHLSGGSKRPGHSWNPLAAAHRPISRPIHRGLPR
jgi:hypothetical protein